jgi:hypothetical protein
LAAHIRTVVYRLHHLDGRIMIEAILLIVGAHIIVAAMFDSSVRPAERAKSRITGHNGCPGVAVSGYGTVPFPTKFSSGSIPISFL